MNYQFVEGSSYVKALLSHPSESRPFMAPKRVEIPKPFEKNERLLEHVDWNENEDEPKNRFEGKGKEPIKMERQSLGEKHKLKSYGAQEEEVRNIREFILSKLPNNLNDMVRELNVKLEKSYIEKRGEIVDKLGVINNDEDDRAKKKAKEENKKKKGGKKMVKEEEEGKKKFKTLTFLDEEGFILHKKVVISLDEKGNKIMSDVNTVNDIEFEEKKTSNKGILMNNMYEMTKLEGAYEPIHIEQSKQKIKKGKATANNRENQKEQSNKQKKNQQQPKPQSKPQPKKNPPPQKKESQPKINSNPQQPSNQPKNKNKNNQKNEQKLDEKTNPKDNKTKKTRTTKKATTSSE